MATTSFTLRIDQDLKARLEREAASEDRSIAAVSQRAIKEFLDRRDAFRLTVEEADAEADAGLLIDGDAMMAWVRSWDTENERPVPTAQSHPFKA